MNTLVKGLVNYQDKSVFFLKRILIILAPYFILTQVVEFTGDFFSSQFAYAILYQIHLIYIFFLWGKVVDHRLKIYYKVHSSIDRFIYRVLMGQVCLLITANLFYLVPISSKMLMDFTWVAFAFYYAWPTRKKVAESLVSQEFSEFKYLDGFEKTLFYFIVLIGLASLPEISLFQNIEALKLYLDPDESIHFALWNSLNFLYSHIPQTNSLLGLIYSLHFYSFGLFIFVFCLYSFFRYFFSRRTSILGIFAFMCSWPLTQYLSIDITRLYIDSTLLVMLWVVTWSLRALSYRSGLIVGFLFFFSTAIEPKSFLLIPFLLIFKLFALPNDKTQWYKVEWFKYVSIGLVLSLIIFITSNMTFQSSSLMWGLNNIIDIFLRKAFYSLSVLGFFLVILSIAIRSGYFSSSKYIKAFELKTDFRQSWLPLGYMVCLIIFSFIIHPFYFSSFTAIWILITLSMVPIELIFSKLKVYRSKRNMIYVLYILMILMDSQIEMRIRISAKMFLSPTTYSHINKY